jgi:hypothetical protein
LDATDILEERIRPFLFYRNTIRNQRKVKLSTLKIPQIIVPLQKNLTGSTTTTATWKSGSKQNNITTATRIPESKKAYQRQYFHARLGLPLTDSEFLNCDSDDDIDMSWEKSAGNRGLSEFEDICQEEKLLMTLWNTHVGTYPPYANAYVPMVADLFVRKFAAEILTKGLRHNLLLHLLNLADFNLLSIEDVHSLIKIVDLVQSNVRSNV